MYVDENYYFSDFEGELIEEPEKYLTLAQEKIDSITFNRIVKIGFDNLTEFQKDKVRKAICYEAQHIFENGYNNDNSSDISSYKVLDINVNIKENTDKTQAEKENMCEIAYDFIKKTGLANRSFRF